MSENIEPENKTLLTRLRSTPLGDLMVAVFLVVAVSLYIFSEPSLKVGLEAPSENAFVSALSGKINVEESLIKDHGDKFGLGFHVLTIDDHKFYAFGDGSVIMQGTLIRDNGMPDISSSMRSDRSIMVSKLSKEVPVIRTGTLGAPKVFVFTDPDCPYCRNLLKNEIPDVEVVNIMIALDGVHPRARSHIQQIFNTGDPALAMRDLMVEGASLPDVFTEEAKKYPFEKVNKAFQEMGLFGTPSLIAPDGSLIPLFLDRPNLIKDMIIEHQ